MKLFTIFSLVIFSGCSSTPSPGKTINAPAWTRQPIRTHTHTDVVFIGVGEDRISENALFKSDAFALQDLANECSFVPKNTVVQAEHFQEQIGLIYRSFSRVSVNLNDCEAAAHASRREVVRNLANAQLESVVETYQKSYDAPEPEEITPLTAKDCTQPLDDPTTLFTLRQKLAHVQKTVILSEKPSNFENVKKVETYISEVEQSAPEIVNGAFAFSTGRLNWINHQPSAMRETIEERMALKKEYGYTPSPLRNSGSKPLAGHGKGSRRRSRQSPSLQSPNSSPSPMPTL